MKARSLFSFGMSLVLWGAGVLPVFAQLSQSQRYPTDQELQQIIQTFREQIPLYRQSGQFFFGRDPRTIAQRQPLESFRKAWSQVNPGVEPFLGDWLGNEDLLAIYPSNVRGRVCIISANPEKIEFSLGTISNGGLNISGGSHDRNVLIVEGNYITFVIVKNDEVGMFTPIVFPLPLKSPTELLEYIDSELLDYINSEEQSRIIKQYHTSSI